MKRQTTFLSIAFLLLATHINLANANSEIEGNVSNTTAVLSAKNIIKGQLGDKIKEETWQYSNQYDDAGNRVNYEETILVYAFNIEDELVGTLNKSTIKVYIPQGLMAQYEQDNSMQDFLEGKSVVIGVSPDSGALQRGNTGFNISHGKHYSAQTEEEVHALKEWITKLHEKKEQPIDAQLEEAYGMLGTGDDINLEQPKAQPDHPHIMHTNSFSEPSQETIKNPTHIGLPKEHNTHLSKPALTPQKNNSQLINIDAPTIIGLCLSFLCVALLLRGFITLRED